MIILRIHFGQGASLLSLSGLVNCIKTHNPRNQALRFINIFNFYYQCKIVKRLTIGYKEYLKKVNPNFNFKVPRRIITHPSQRKRYIFTKLKKAVYNDNLDNKDFDLILHVNDQLINSKKQLFYIVDDFLGKGTFGQVVKCHTINSEQFAIKVIKNQPAYNQQCITEIEVLKSLAIHNHIIQLKDQFIHQKHICLVFQLMSYSIYDFLKHNHFEGVGVKLTRKWIKMILEGLIKAEECGVVHADLKPENIMIQENKQDYQESILKIIDFGSSCFMNKKPPYMYIQSRFYRAPEIILRYSNYTSFIKLICGVQDVLLLNCFVDEPYSLVLMNIHVQKE